MLETSLRLKPPEVAVGGKNRSVKPFDFEQKKGPFSGPFFITLGSWNGLSRKDPDFNQFFEELVLERLAPR
jgi:hypothetical protein